VLSGEIRLSGIASLLPCEVYFWPIGRSYTGQPVAEIHTLGCGPLLESVVRVICAAGARLAEPGEFTLRAFLAHRIDLTQAEAVLGVIDAADPHQLDVALAQLAGGLAGPLDRLRDKLLDLLAHLEAGFDFADEDLPFIAPDELDHQLDAAVQMVDRLARQMESRGETAGAVRAVLVGRPNSGKSSLFNALVRRTGALVSDDPGTTRDYLLAELDLDGVKCELIDTAGLETEPAEPADASPSVRQAAAAISTEQNRQAHVRILCLDATRPSSDTQWGDPTLAPGREQLIVLTKIDAVEQSHFREAVRGGDLQHALRTSSRTGQGIDALREELRMAVLSAAASGAQVVAGTAARCRESLRLAAESLARAGRILHAEAAEELVAAEIRTALDELGRVVGAVYTDDVLDRIFGRFCIGK
jgi:tRNA modification GTPase